MPSSCDYFFYPLHWVTCTTPRHTTPHHSTIVHHTRTISCDLMSCSHCPLRPRISGAEQACLHHAAAAKQRHSFRARGVPYVTSARAHICIHTDMHSHTHTCTYMYIHIIIHIYIHTHSDTHTHSHTPHHLAPHHNPNPKAHACRCRVGGKVGSQLTILYKRSCPTSAPSTGTAVSARQNRGQGKR